MACSLALVAIAKRALLALLLSPLKVVLGLLDGLVGLREAQIIRVWHGDTNPRELLLREYGIVPLHSAAPLITAKPLGVMSVGKRDATLWISAPFHLVNPELAEVLVTEGLIKVPAPVLQQESHLLLVHGNCTKQKSCSVGYLTPPQKRK